MSGRWKSSLGPVILIAVAAVSLAACGSSKKSASTATTTTTPADGLIQAGITAENKGNTAGALADYQKAIKANPLSKIAYYDLGVIYQQENDVADASTNYQKAILIDPTYKSALFNLAILDTKADPTMAVSLYDKLLGLNANDTNVLFNLGLLLRQTGNATQGNAYLAKAIRLDPALASRLPATSTTKP